MGWNTCAAFVKQPVERVLVALAADFTPSDREIHFEQASSWSSLDPNVAIATMGEWTAVWCPTPYCVFETTYMQRMQELSRDSEVLAVYLQSVVDSYGFRYYVDGERVREVRYLERKLADNHGKPLAAEDDIEMPSWGYDESWIFTIVSRLVGDIDLDAKCRLLVPGGAAVAPAAAKKTRAAKTLTKRAAKQAKPIATFAVDAEGVVKAKTKAKTKTKTKAQPKPKAKAQLKPKARAKAKAQPKPKAKAKAQPKPKAKAKAQPKPKAKTKRRN